MLEPTPQPGSVADPGVDFRPRVVAHERKRAKAPDPPADGEKAGILESREKGASLLRRKTSQGSSPGHEGKKVHEPQEELELPHHGRWPVPERIDHDALGSPPLTFVVFTRRGEKSFRDGPEERTDRRGQGIGHRDRAPGVGRAPFRVRQPMPPGQGPGVTGGDRDDRDDGGWRRSSKASLAGTDRSPYDVYEELRDSFSPSPMTPTRPLRTHIRPILGAILLGGVASCMEPIPAGNDAGPLGSAPERALIETLRLGGIEAGEEEAFQREPGLTVRPDGSIYVLHSERGRIAAFDAEGSFQLWLGGQGEGPGEFRIAASIGRVDDTLWVRNFPEPRISRFLPDGTHVSTRTALYDFGIPLSAPAGISGVLRGDRVYVEAAGFPVGQDGQVQLPALVGDPELTRMDTLFTVPSPRGRLGGTAFAPFRQPPYHHLAPDGSGVVLAEWSEHAPGELMVRFFGPDAGERWSWRLSVPPQPISDALRDSVVEDGAEVLRTLAERLRELGVPEAQIPSLTHAEIESQIYLPEAEPPIRDVRVGIDGTIWLQRSDGPREGPWVAFEPDGTALFQVRLPHGATLRQASREAVWGVESDEMEVPFVVRWDVADSRP